MSSLAPAHNALDAAGMLRQHPPLAPFSALAIDFVAAFSQALRTAPTVRRYPELSALAFWMRKGHIEALAGQFASQPEGHLFRPRGTVFHIAPGNVDSIFIYSWFLSLLCGNRNIVRLPSRASPQLEVLLEVLDGLLAAPQWQAIAARTVLARYPREALAITEGFSSVCDLRVVWGGDATIGEIRCIALPARADEICFADRFSMALVNASGWLQAAAGQQEQWLRRFHADAYTFGQMACSSPRLVAWLGSQMEVRAAREQFWPGLHAISQERAPTLMAIDYVNKSIAADLVALRLRASIPAVCDNLVSRIEVAATDVLSLIDAGLHCGAGLFYETRIEALQDLNLFVDQRMQTMIHAGFENTAELANYLEQEAPPGISRVLPFGRALEFSSVWDGHDLLRNFTRQVFLA